METKLIVCSRISIAYNRSYGLNKINIMSRDEFIEYVETLHLQNLSGREDFHKAFQLGIGAAFDEIEELGLFAVVQVCECGNEKHPEASRCETCM
jgi:hypothetical protein